MDTAECGCSVTWKQAGIYVSCLHLSMTMFLLVCVIKTHIEAEFTFKW